MKEKNKIFSIGLSVVILFVSSYYLFTNYSTYIASAFLTLIILFLTVLYLIATKQIKFLSFTKYKIIEKWVLNSMIGAILLSWLGTFIYGYIFPNTDSKLLNQQEIIITEIQKGSEKIDNISIKITNDIIQRIDSISTSQKVEVETLKIENKLLREKLKKLSISNLFPNFQERIEILFGEYKYQKARHLLIEFRDSHRNLHKTELSKIYYQISLTYFAEKNYINAKKSIEKSVQFDDKNYEIHKQHTLIIKEILSQTQRNNNKSNTRNKQIVQSFNSSSDLVISVDKANVIYKGILNPLSISVCGFQEKNIKVKGYGLKKISKGKYSVNPTGYSEKELIISVSASENGRTVNENRKFRVENISTPSISLNKRTGNFNISKSRLENSKIDVVIPNFTYDMNIKVISFSIKTPDNPTVICKGSKMSSIAKRYIKKTKKNDKVIIFDVRTKISASSNIGLKKPREIILTII